MGRQRALLSTQEDENRGGKGKREEKGREEEKRRGEEKEEERREGEEGKGGKEKTERKKVPISRIFAAHVRDKSTFIALTSPSAQMCQARRSWLDSIF